MKKIVYPLFLIMSFTSEAQPRDTVTVKNQKTVKVKDWNKKIFLFPEDYWHIDSIEIIKQIGSIRFQQVKKHSNYRDIPKEMSLYNAAESKLADTAKLYKKLSELKLYKIATYTHFNSKNEDKGKWVILSVPYNENKSWDTNVQWKSLYFILPEPYIEEIN